MRAPTMRLLFSALSLAAAVAALRAQSSVPVVSQPIPAQTLAPGGAAATVDLAGHFVLPGLADQTALVAQIETVVGRFNLELFSSAAPRTVQNFQAYITAGRYQNTFIHRAVTGFVIQGGGYTATVPHVHIPTFPAVVNEFRMANIRGTVAMAKLGSDPNSATSEWFVNLADNRANLDNQNGGFTVFARVLGTGMTVVDAIAALPRYKIGFDDSNPTVPASTPLRNVPPNETQLRSEYYVTVTNVRMIPVYPAVGAATAVLAFTAVSSNPAVVTAALAGSALSLTPVGAGTASVTVRATDTNGNTAEAVVAVTVSASAPAIVSHPAAQTIAAGSTVVFGVVAANAISYQWARNGTTLNGATNATLIIPSAVAANAGSYTCVASGPGGPAVTSAPALLTVTAASPAESGRLINLAIRTAAGTGAQTLIVGFAVGGAGTAGPKPLLLRGVGPSLGQFGLTGTLADPVMTVIQDGTTVATNDDWAGDAQVLARATQVGAFALAAPTSPDAALASSPAPGAYTVQIVGKAGGTGLALAEIYDATAAPGAAVPRLINVSARTQVGTGGDILIAGFVIGGTTARTVLIRAIGPALAGFGVPGVLADPRLQLFEGGRVIRENDNWGGDLQLTTIGASVGAFTLFDGTSRDAMLLVTLAPGSYTAQISGVNNGTGVALVEVYEVP